MKREEGFTLVELLVSFTVGAVVALAATSVLLLGLRFNAISTGTAQRQNTTRMLMSVLESVVAEGTMTKVESTLQSWKVYGEDDHVILSYNDADDAIYSGTYKILEGVVASHISLSNGLLTVSLETEDGSYTSSVYCRMYKEPASVESTPELDTDEELISKIEVNSESFVSVLLSQYPRYGFPNVGVILDEHGNGTKEYYATWYAKTKALPLSGWDSSTPWCACFISWAMWETIDENVRKNIDTDKLFANVDDFMESVKPLTKNFAVGNVIFFDWNGDKDPEHVGVVLLSDDQYVYTIEGNSADVVALRMYKKNDPCILGAGTINWEALVKQ